MEAQKESLNRLGPAKTDLKGDTLAFFKNHVAGTGLSVNLQSVENVGKDFYVVTGGKPRTSVLMNSNGDRLAEGKSFRIEKAGTALGHRLEDGKPLAVVAEDTIVMVNRDRSLQDVRLEAGKGTAVLGPPYDAFPRGGAKVLEREAADEWLDKLPSRPDVVENNASVERVGKYLYLVKGWQDDVNGKVAPGVTSVHPAQFLVNRDGDVLASGREIKIDAGVDRGGAADRTFMVVGRPGGSTSGMEHASRFIHVDGDTGELHFSGMVEDRAIERTGDLGIKHLPDGNAVMAFAERDYTLHRNKAFVNPSVDIHDKDFEYSKAWSELPHEARYAYASKLAYVLDRVNTALDGGLGKAYKTEKEFEEAKEKLSRVLYEDRKVASIRGNIINGHFGELSSDFPSYYELRGALLEDADIMLSPLNRTREYLNFVEALDEMANRRIQMDSAPQTGGNAATEQGDGAEENNENVEDKTSGAQGEESPEDVKRRFDEYHSRMKEASGMTSEVSIDGIIASEPKKIGDTAVFLLRIPGAGKGDDRYISAAVPAGQLEEDGVLEKGEAVSIKGSIVKEPTAKGEAPNYTVVGDKAGKSEVLEGRLTPARVASAVLWKAPATLVQAALKGTWWAAKNAVKLFPAFLGCLTIVGIPIFLAKLAHVIGEGLGSAPKGIVSCIPGKPYGDKLQAFLKENGSVLAAAMKAAPAVQMKKEPKQEKNSKKNAGETKKTEKKADEAKQAAKEEAAPKVEQTKEPVDVKREFRKETGNSAGNRVIVGFGDIIGEKSNGKYVCMDSDGKYVYTDDALNVLGAGYKALIPFGSSELGPEFGIAKMDDGRLAIIDGKGKELAAGLSGLKTPVNGVSVLKIKDSEGETKEMYFDLTAQSVIGKDTFKKCYPFDSNSGLARVVTSDGKENLIGKDGNVLSPVGFDKMLGYYGEHPVVRNNAGKVVFLASQGREFLQMYGVNAKDIVPGQVARKSNQPINGQEKAQVKNAGKKATTAKKTEPSVRSLKL